MSDVQNPLTAVLGPTIGPVKQKKREAVTPERKEFKPTYDLSDRAQHQLTRLCNRTILQSSDLTPRELAEILNRVFR